MNDDGGLKAFVGTWPGDETDEELLAMCREVRRQGPRWISLDERKPDGGMPVLLWFASPRTRILKYADVGCIGIDGNWVIDGRPSFDRPSHWMPLPEPPA
jgi:hypothetical protein